AVAPHLVPESPSSRNLGDWVRRFVAGADAPMPDRYIGWTRFFDDDRLGRLATPALRAELAGPVDEAQRSAFATRDHGDPLDGTLEGLLGPDQIRARGLFEPAAVERLKAEHLAGARTHADRLWTLMMAELWIREYLEPRGVWTLR